MPFLRIRKKKLLHIFYTDDNSSAFFAVFCHAYAGFCDELQRHGLTFGQYVHDLKNVMDGAVDSAKKMLGAL